MAGLALRKGAGAGMWGSLAESYDLTVVLKGCFTSSKLAIPKINPEGDAQE